MQFLPLLIALAIQDDPLTNLRAWSETREGSTRVVVRCGTSLPDGAVLQVSLTRESESFEGETRKLVSRKSADSPRSARRPSEKGKAEADFDKVEEGAYLAAARFDPEMQSDEVTARGARPEARIARTLLVGVPAGVLKGIADEESAIRSSLAELVKIGAAGGADAKVKLMKWFEEESTKLPRRWLPATRDYLRTETRKIAIWGSGPLRSGAEAKEEANWKEFYDMIFTARQMMPRERFLWDLRIASTLAMEMLVAAESADPAAEWGAMKERQQESWAAIDAGLSAIRVREVTGMVGEAGTRLLALLRAGRDLADRLDPKASDAAAKIGAILRGIQSDEPAARIVPKYAPVK